MSVMPRIVVNYVFLKSHQFFFAFTSSFSLPLTPTHSSLSILLLITAFHCAPTSLCCAPASRPYTHNPLHPRTCTSVVFPRTVDPSVPSLPPRPSLPLRVPSFSPATPCNLLLPCALEPYVVAPPHDSSSPLCCPASCSSSAQPRYPIPISANIPTPFA